MEESKIDFIFTWGTMMPQRHDMYLFRYIDGETYEIDMFGHVSGNFAIFDDIDAIFPSHQRISLLKADIEQLRKFSVKWKRIR